MWVRDCSLAMTLGSCHEQSRTRVGQDSSRTGPALMRQSVAEHGSGRTCGRQTHPCRPGSSSGAGRQQSGSRTWAPGTVGHAQLHAVRALPSAQLQPASPPLSMPFPAGGPARGTTRVRGWSWACMSMLSSLSSAMQAGHCDRPWQHGWCICQAR